MDRSNVSQDVRTVQRVSQPSWTARQSFEMIVHGNFAPQHTWPRGRGVAVRILTWGPEMTPGSDLVEQIGSGPPALTDGANQAQLCSSALLVCPLPELPGRAAYSAAVRVRNQPSPCRTARSMAGPESPPMIKGIGRCTGIGHTPAARGGRTGPRR